MLQHYIPQYYLEGFIELPSSPLLWVYEKGCGRVFTTTPKAVAAENNRWSPETERYLANEVEAPANAVLDKTRKHHSLTPDDKRALSAYMIVLLHRVPAGWNRTKRYVPAFFDDLEEHVSRLTRENPLKIEIIRKRQAEIRDLRANYERGMPRELWPEYLKPDFTPMTFADLLTMNWVFLTSSGKQRFLACDNPVFFFEDLGIGNQESELSFPVSGEVALWATWRADTLGEYVPAKDSQIMEINRRTAANATRYAYFSQQAQWVISLINRRNPRLRKLS